MKNTWILIQREIKERTRSFSFWGLAILGPIVFLLLLFFLFHFGENQKPKWRILVSDPTMIMDNRILLNDVQNFEFDFINNYVEIDDFVKGKRYQAYDGLLEVNEKVLSNKVAYFFYKEKPSLKIQSRLHYLLEKRLEEVYVQEVSDLPIKTYRQIKQPINLGFRNAFDPKEEKANLNSWVGWTFGALILFFIFIFGMTLLRSISVEKSNRIVEVLLATIQPKQLLFSKIIGVGITAFIQLFIWIILIGAGLYLFKEQFFMTMNDQALAGNITTDTSIQTAFGITNLSEYNQFVELIFQRIDFSVMLVYFLLFLVLGYLFYGTIFASLGAMMGTESDGQQYVILISAILFFALISGYLAISIPESSLVNWLAYLPFTSPVVCMVKISQGYSTGEFYQLFLSIGILILSIIIGILIAGRLYKNGILKFGYRLRFKDFFK